MTLTRFAEEDVTDMGVGEVHPISAEEKKVEKDLVDLLEADGQTTGTVGLFSLLFQHSVLSRRQRRAARFSFFSFDIRTFPPARSQSASKWWHARLHVPNYV